jgi:hypothetical protein
MSIGGFIDFLFTRGRTWLPTTLFQGLNPEQVGRFNVQLFTGPSQLGEELECPWAASSEFQVKDRVARNLSIMEPKYSSSNCKPPQKRIDFEQDCHPDGSSKSCTPAAMSAEFGCHYYIASLVPL